MMSWDETGGACIMPFGEWQARPEAQVQSGSIERGASAGACSVYRYLRRGLTLAPSWGLDFRVSIFGPWAASISPDRRRSGKGKTRFGPDMRFCTVNRPPPTPPSRPPLPLSPSRACPHMAQTASGRFLPLRDVTRLSECRCWLVRTMGLAQHGQGG